MNRNHKKWWQETVFYEIYMPSFCDGNGDGIGDFPGITSKLDYLKELGIGGVWLTPFYQSPKIDNGYDISDYYAVDPEYGTMEDFDSFIHEAHERGIRVIVDLVLNHTSSAHAWFQESRSSILSAKRDWYIWKSPDYQKAPNNWESFFGGSAWEWDESTKQYYYHAFAKEQVDLNWANPEVRQAMKDVMGFWLDKGIDGFRLDVINFLKVSGDFQDNPVDANGEQVHLYDQNQDGILEAIGDICRYVHKREGIFMVGEVGSEDMDILRLYSGSGLLDVVFNFNLGSQENFRPEDLFREIKLMEERHTSEQLPTLFFSSHDMQRHISRFGEGDMELEEQRAKLMAALLLTAKGVPFIYYGDEIGMRNYNAHRIEDMRDIQGLGHYKAAIENGLTEEEALRLARAKSRDYSRSPMQWNGDRYGGFSDQAPWIGMGPGHDQIHTAAQQKQTDSIYAFYKRLLALRKQHPALSIGEYVKLEQLNGAAIVYTKRCGSDEAVVVLQFGSEPLRLDLFDWSGSKLALRAASQEILPLGESVVEIPPHTAVVWVN
ncbi:trehalose-6-phosphate hydrolase [Paenibacillus catalpae]|uniref:Trehalose-6-phosphate hydrolase n=1 Tax=Paenibacillus catalpae TaxID=1045775 RepID=A0A1I1XVK8_9BACL|nr:alpha-glucosidase [Paenibacillus catalpae]SFE11334.1 trehalose-6-phosphate hydrolase [Paenibacillus catalpae]